MPLRRVINRSRLAEALEISPQTVYQWFNNISLPSARILIKAANLLEITPEELINEIEGHNVFEEKIKQIVNAPNNKEQPPKKSTDNFYKKINKLYE